MSSVCSTKSVETINGLGSVKSLAQQSLEKSIEKFETDTAKETRISISSESETDDLLALPSFQVPAAPAPELSTAEKNKPYKTFNSSQYQKNSESSEPVPQENPKNASENLENQVRNCIMSSTKIGATAIIAGIAVVAVLTLGYLSAVTVEAGHVGVVKRFGAVQEPALEPGFHFITPFITSVYEYDTRITSVEHSSTASSKDLQTVSTGVSVQYYIDGGSAPKIVQKVGDRVSVEASVISPAIMESVKSVTARYTAEQLLTQRSQVKTGISNEIKRFIKQTLDAKDVGTGVSIANVAVTDFKFSDEFNKAIEMKVKTEQQALQAENEKKTRITQAEASKQEMQLAADAEAYAISKNAKARADAIKMEANALRNEPQLIQLRLAEKWDGALPKFTGGGDDSTMLLDIDSIMNTKSREVRKKLEHRQRSG